MTSKMKFLVDMYTCVPWFLFIVVTICPQEYTILDTSFDSCLLFCRHCTVEKKI